MIPCDFDQDQMMKVHLTSLGCRLNQSEIDSMAREFTYRGDEVMDTADGADLFVINTCAVTQEATRSSRQLIHRLHRISPAAQIAVTGCYSNIGRTEVATLPGVTHIVDNLDKESLVQIVAGERLEAFDHEPITRDRLAGAQGRTRAFIKVQDGCDRFCSFCVTRVARGKGRSRALLEIVAEIRDLHAAGYQEAVLTGVHLGSYGHDLGQTDLLHQLIRAILDDTDIPRIRLSSLEPWGITPGFFDLWQNPRLCRHLHLPLQSGCDATLRRMIRRTSQAEFREVIEATRQAIPDVAIATDIIVGFPGETDDEFAISREFIKEMDFADMHIFRYSKRPGTAAARLPDQVSEEAKRRRSDELHALQREQEQHFARQFVGKSMPILWEAVGGATDHGFINSGYTDNYLRVRCVVPEVLTNQISMARLVNYDAQSALMHGELFRDTLTLSPSP
jgi:threonylcarbamoyladenosine tRNA methylthiotransferase MtaB